MELGIIDYQRAKHKHNNVDKVEFQSIIRIIEIPDCFNLLYNRLKQRDVEIKLILKRILFGFT